MQSLSWSKSHSDVYPLERSSGASKRAVHKSRDFLRIRTLVLAICAGLLTYSAWRIALHRVVWENTLRALLRTFSFPDPDLMCPQAPHLTPSIHSDLAGVLDALYARNDFKKVAAEVLSGAVRIPTVTFDDMGAPSEDLRWSPFEDFYAYLEAKFTQTFLHLEVVKINKHALVLRWEGSDSSLKPIVLTGHQDVVPAPEETLDQWIHPPFSGHYDGTWIWGRGSLDDKSTVISTLTSVETLMTFGFNPRRTVILAFGIDEEIGGVYGAKEINKYLLEVYGENGIALLVDEGGGYMNFGNATIAAPMTAEKGKVNVLIEVTTPGGHSSMPPPHTGIGYLSKLASALEDHPFPLHLKRNTAAFNSVQCIAAYDLSLPSAYRTLVARAAAGDDRALEQVQQALLAQGEFHDLFAARLGTTQAIDIVRGGVKVNALPERVYAVVDHRIADWSSVDDVYAHYIDIFVPLATHLNLTLDAFGLPLSSTATQPSAKGHVRLSTTNGEPLPPAPLPSTFGTPVWDLLAGTIRATLASAQRTDGGISQDGNGVKREAFVGPDLMQGTTDTHWYWNLTRNIYRYAHIGYTDLYNGAHTVNEAFKAEGLIEMIRFHTRLILNADETDLLDRDAY